MKTRMVHLWVDQVTPSNGGGSTPRETACGKSVARRMVTFTRANVTCPGCLDAPVRDRSGMHYIGDGLYASRDRWGAITLHAPRSNAEHYVVLDESTLRAFDAWREATKP